MAGRLQEAPCTTLPAAWVPHQPRAQRRWLPRVGNARRSLSRRALVFVKKATHQGSMRCRAQASGEGAPAAPPLITEADLDALVYAARLADSSAGETQPHPNSACVIHNRNGALVAEAFLWAQGTESAESKAVTAAGAAARGGSAYLNLEPGDCHGEAAAVEALVRSGAARVVVGLRHPAPHFRGAAVEALRRAGVVVQVLGEEPCAAGVSEEQQAAALDACLAVNAALLHRIVTKKPLGVLKYAMTLDGKIATAQGHSAWVSSPQSRQRVFEVRGRSDAVIVGGQTVRRDNPQLTTRREGGHQPARIVMSRTLDLPENAKLWDVSHAPTIIMTQRGARRPFQRLMRSRGVEVVEFDFLTPEAVARYCAERGWLQCLWECGGVLAAPAIRDGAVHRVMAFVAPKLIGGNKAPTPVDDLGFVEMTQALVLEETQWEPSGPDLMLTGYLPQSGGLRALADAAGVLPRPALSSSSAGGSSSGSSSSDEGAWPAAAAAGPAAAAAPAAGGSTVHPTVVGSGRSKWVSAAPGAPVAEFYKAWDLHGCLSNFSPHAICMPGGPMTADRLRSLLREVPQGLEACGLPPAAGAPPAAASTSESRQWASVEHYYQAQKFAGVANEEAAALVESIAAAPSPEQAAGLGRRWQWSRPDLVRDDWDRSKLAVMYAALRAKFATHAGPREMLLSSAAATVAAAAVGAGQPGVAAAAAGDSLLQAAEPAAPAAPASVAAAAATGDGLAAPSAAGVVLVESSPHDFFWGRGFDGSGQNLLGRLLMCLREEMARDAAGAEV